MKVRRMSRLLGVVVGLGVAQAAYAVPSATTAPLGVGAPALGIPMLLFLAAVMAGVAIVRVNRISAAAKAVAVLVVCGGLAAAAYAYTVITISGIDCTRTSTFEYNSNNRVSLKSECPLPVEVIALNPECDEMLVSGLTTDTEEDTSAQPCEVGLVLHDGDRCKLPRCNII